VPSVSAFSCPPSGAHGVGTPSTDSASQVEEEIDGGNLLTPNQDGRDLSARAFSASALGGLQLGEQVVANGQRSQTTEASQGHKLYESSGLLLKHEAGSETALEPEELNPRSDNYFVLDAAN
jgi:hypothetical protein